MRTGSFLAGLANGDATVAAADGKGGLEVGKLGHAVVLLVVVLLVVAVLVVVLRTATVGAAPPWGGTLHLLLLLLLLAVGDQGWETAAASKLNVFSRLRGQSRPHLHTPSVCRYLATSSRLRSWWLLGL